MNKDRMKVLQEMFKEEPDNSFLLFAIAKEYEKMGNFSEAITTFLLLQKKDEDYVGLYYHLAKLYEQIEEELEAMAIYEAGIAIAKKVKDQHALAELQNAKLNLEIGM